MADQKKALKQEGEEAIVPEATPAPEVEPEAPEDSEEVPEPAEPAGEVGEEEAETGEKSKKKGYSQRVQELNARAKKAEAKAESLAEKVAKLTAPVGPAPQVQTKPQPDEPIVKPGEEITATELDKRLKAREAGIIQRADAIALIRSRQQDAMTRINNEAVEACKKYPELDPDSDSFDQDLSDSVTGAVEDHVKANPYGASVKKRVARLMNTYKRSVAKEAGKVTEKVAKQASETALRPVSVKGGEKKFEDKSLKEMEDQLGIVY